MRILVIEDDAPTAHSMELMLRSESFKVELTDLGEEGLELAKLYDYDAITLDLGLPDVSGFDVLRHIRRAGIRTPIMIVSGLAGIEDKVKCLGLGADDYLTKPFHKDELVARLNALVRRSKGLAKSIITTGNIALNLNTKTVSVDGNAVHLTGKEYQMLELLSLRKGMTLSKDAFMSAMYGGMDEPELKIVDVYICKLRKKLDAAGAEPMIVNIWGRGYVLRDPDFKSPSMASEVADLADDPPTGFVSERGGTWQEQRDRALKSALKEKRNNFVAT